MFLSPPAHNECLYPQSGIFAHPSLTDRAAEAWLSMFHNCHPQTKALYPCDMIFFKHPFTTDRPQGASQQVFLFPLHKIWTHKCELLLWPCDAYAQKQLLPRCCNTFSYHTGVKQILLKSGWVFRRGDFYLPSRIGTCLMCTKIGPTFITTTLQQKQQQSSWNCLTLGILWFNKITLLSQKLEIFCVSFHLWSWRPFPPG